MQRGVRRRKGWYRRCAGAACLFAAAAAAAVAPASAETRAGTAIVNVATLHQVDRTVASNEAIVVVAERLDVSLAHQPASDAPGVVAVTLVNRGNGDEAFAIAATASGGAAAGVPAIAVAGGAPVPLVEGRTPSIAPGASTTLFIPVTAGATDGVLAVSARAVTGSGSPGTLVTGQGDGGGDAVVGPTGASASVSIPLNAVADPVPTLVKSQAVSAPDGSATPMPGARVTYTLVATFAAAAGDATIVDPIPAGTTYAPGTLTIDGIPLNDAGRIDAGRLVVPLGAVAAGATRTLRFTVVIS